MVFPALTAHVFPSIICTATKGDDIAPFTEFFLACPQGHNTVCLFGFHKVKEAYLGNTETLLWTFTFAILNQVWQLQWKIFTAVDIYWGGGVCGVLLEERRLSVSLHILLNSSFKISLLHTRGKRRKCQDLDFTIFPEHIADSLEPPITDKSGTCRELFTPICVEEF